MTIQEIIEEVKHTIEYFTEPFQTQVQAGRVFEAKKILNLLNKLPIENKAPTEEESKQEREYWVGWLKNRITLQADHHWQYVRFALQGHNKDLLERYSKFLSELGYMDDDWWAEKPTAIERFLRHNPTTK